MAYEDLNKKDGDVEDEAAPENHMDGYIKGPVGSSVGDEYPQILQKDGRLNQENGYAVDDARHTSPLR